MTKAKKRLTVSEKRLLVIDDVLAQLRKRTRCMIPSSGIYINSDVFYDLERGPGLAESTCIQQYIDEIQNGCEVCGIGAIMLSHIRLNNKITVKQFHRLSGSTIIEHLSGIFTRDQLKLIEAAFEGYYTCDGKALAFFNKYHNDDKKRLRAIFNNMKINEGIFKP